MTSATRRSVTRPSIPSKSIAFQVADSIIVLNFEGTPTRDLTPYAQYT